MIAHAGDSTFVSSPGAGNATVRYHTGTIEVSGNSPRGIVAWAEGDGSANVTTDPGTTIIVKGRDPGGPVDLPVKAAISLQLDSATAATGSATADVSSSIIDIGPATPDGFFSNPVGIRALTFASAPITVKYKGPGITTHGGGAAGIMALSDSGRIAVISSGPIDTTDGLGAVGILADSGGTILSRSSGVLDSGKTLAKGSVSPTLAAGIVEVDASNIVHAGGEFGTGISATGGDGGVRVKILPGGVVMGGWQADLTSIGATYSLPATGVNLSSNGGNATLINDGSIGALSDRAVTGDPRVINNGTITGFVQFGGSGNGILNNGVFNLRHFADIDGDGVRDALRVAVADLGLGNDSFDNKGTLALGPVSGATTLDSAGEYLPLGNAANKMTLNGPLQGQMIGVAKFTNSGVIDLQSDPVAGDVLVITGARTAAAAGPGQFISDGGSLMLDTVLNQGGVATRSDTLVVDATKVGAGATKIFVHNVGGSGELTVGNGILVVQVKGQPRSAAGAFSLGNEVAAGPYEYLLFHGGVNGSRPGDWFLRDEILPPPDPGPSPGPGPTPPIVGPVLPGPGPTPVFRPEVSTDVVVPSLELAYGLQILDNLHERVGEEEQLRGRADLQDGQFANGAWARVIGWTAEYQAAQFGIFTGGPKYDANLVAVQGGLDIYRAEHADGSRDHAGAYFAYGGIDADVTNFNGLSAGTASLNNNVSLAGYWTHFGPAGQYLDGVIQGTWYNVSTDGGNGYTLNGSAAGLALSLEGGWPLPLGGGWEVEPQGQLVYDTVNNGQMNDGAALVRFENVDSLAGRIGARFAHTFAISSDPQPRLMTFWVRPNLWHEFLPAPTTEFSSQDGLVPFHTNAIPWLGELNLGTTVELTRTASVYADADYSFDFNGRFQGFAGKLGLRFNW